MFRTRFCGRSGDLARPASQPVRRWPASLALPAREFETVQTDATRPAAAAGLRGCIVASGFVRIRVHFWCALENDYRLCCEHDYRRTVYFSKMVSR